MACWSENYHFIKEVYDFRVEEMNKWMDALEESSKKLITNKVYTSREFRRMRDQFRYQCKNLKREELKVWLADMLKLLNQKSDQNLETEKKRLEALIQRHTEVLPGIEENMRKVDVYSRCYQYVDDITPLLKLLEDLRRKSTEDIHPDSTEQVTTFIENQEANIAKIEEKRGEFQQLLKRGEKLEGQADCPDFLKEQVKGLSELFMDTEQKAKLKLDILKNNEKAWQEYEEDKVTMVNLLDQADEKLRNIRKLFDPQQGAEDLSMRTEQAEKTRQANEACFTKLKANVDIICGICSPDKKEELGKIMKGFEERNAVLTNTDDRISKLKKYTTDLQTFVDKKEASLAWLKTGQEQLDELMKFPGEDKSDEKLLMTVKMQKDMETQLTILAGLITESERLLGGKNNSVAEGHLLEVEQVKNKLEELNNKLKEVSGEISEDLHHWADYQAELKTFQPWVTEVEERIKGGQKKPTSLSEAQEMLKSVQEFDTDIKTRLGNLDKMTETVTMMTQHEKADREITECRERRQVAEKVSAEWVEKTQKLVQQWEELNATVTEVQGWVAAAEKVGESPNQDTVDATLNKLKGFFAEKQKLVEAL
ncbi:polyamine-modulated factor 1-binding protein 1-like isoform X2 [Pollicipes pollicipes]|uniref:polyamine-modulated factor 1-binding protein 1-like isoform X2 n=1 Tax=Pollicipes pollicipes TaxID=41117 RepID=UPI0018857FF8|nr:polyamine-modulated factor 1-binding protein 1-like isoform X2 [Pollicipes pollicipes]XP_037070833.1 polyamine-modulated factor 1-binding protein 1-like isoform X2 [Pollicipes pollicipes]